MSQLLPIIGVVGASVTAYYLSGSGKSPTERKSAPIATTVAELDATIERVSQNAEAWVKLPNSEKLAILQEMHQILADIREEVGPKGDELRGYVGTASEGIGYILTIVPTAGWLKGLIETYTALVNTNQPAAVVGRRRVGNNEVVKTHPRPGMWEKITNGMEIELWGEDGKAMPQTGPSGSGVCGILCAGNFEGPVDLLYKMFVEQQVVICKNHPINSHCTDVLHAKLLAPLVSRGFAGLCSGGVDISARLVNHPLVDNWMMTGGASTYDAIVWGGAKGKAANKKALNKECHAELGAASPYIITPGKWTDAEVTYQAKMLLGFKFFNSGHICASPQTVIVDPSWPQAKQFVSVLEQEAAKWPAIKPYYPGAQNRVDTVAAKYPNSIKTHSLVLVPDLDAPENKEAEYFTCTESFAAALGIKFLEGNNDAATFLSRVVEFTNKKCSGSLSCSLIIDPRTRASLGSKFDTDVLVKLEWGTIGVNTWGGMGASNPYGVWGAHKGSHTAEDIQSGVGFMGNCLFVNNIKKQVLSGKWCDPGPLALFTQSEKTKAVGVAFSNMAIRQGFTDFLGVGKALLFGGKSKL